MDATKCFQVSQFILNTQLSLYHNKLVRLCITADAAPISLLFYSPLPQEQDLDILKPLYLGQRLIPSLEWALHSFLTYKCYLIATELYLSCFTLDCKLTQCQLEVIASKIPVKSQNGTGHTGSTPQTWKEKKIQPDIVSAYKAFLEQKAKSELSLHKEFTAIYLTCTPKRSPTSILSRLAVWQAGDWPKMRDSEDWMWTQKQNYYWAF